MLKHFFSKTPVVAVAVVVVLGLAGCDIVDQLNNPGSLSVNRFTASPRQIQPGTATTLSWDVDGAETVEIDHGVGKVKEKDSSYVKPERTTTFTLTARNGTSVATQSLEVLVGVASPSPSPGSSPSPTPSPTPTPTPTPSPTPSPSPSPSPTATPTPSPTPTPTPTPTPIPTPVPVTCGETISQAGNCSVVVKRPVALPAGQCIALNLLSANQACPTGFNTTRALRFDITTHTSRTALRWRRAETSSDLLDPNGGAVSSQGVTSVLVNDLVLYNEVTFEVVDGEEVLMRYTLRHY